MTNPIAPNDQLNALLNAFTIEAGGTTNPYVQAITATIAATPSLTNRLNNEAASGALIGIHYQAGGKGAYFEAGAIYIGSDFVQPMGEPIKNINDLIFVLGHEDKHVANGPAMASFDGAWSASTSGLISGWNSTPGNGELDLTTTIKDRIDAHLRDEGSANIQGVNDVLSRAQAANSGALLSQQSIADLWEESRYLGTFFYRDGTTKPGYERDDFGFLQMSEANIALAAAEQATASPSTAGGVAANYAHWYGRDALNVACAAADGKAFSVDFSALGWTTRSAMDPQSGTALLGSEVNAIFVGLGIDPGPSGICRVRDTSSGAAYEFQKSPSGQLTGDRTGLPVGEDVATRDITRTSESGDTGSFEDVHYVQTDTGNWLPQSRTWRSTGTDPDTGERSTTETRTTYASDGFSATGSETATTRHDTSGQLQSAQRTTYDGSGTTVLRQETTTRQADNSLRTDTRDGQGQLVGRRQVWVFDDGTALASDLEADGRAPLNAPLVNAAAKDSGITVHDLAFGRGAAPWKTCSARCRKWRPRRGGSGDCYGVHSKQRPFDAGYGAKRP